MKRIILIFLILSVFNINVSAKGKDERNLSRMTYGIEWNYITSLYKAYRFNYFVPDGGYLVEDRGNSFTFISNADAYAHIGCNLNKNWNISIYIGYEGISDIHTAIPVSLRATRHFNERRNGDRWFSYAAAGSGIGLKQPIQEIFTGKVGGGYSMALNRRLSLDFLISARFSYTHPRAIYDGELVPMSKTTRNNACIGGISFGMALNFN